MSHQGAEGRHLYRPAGRQLATWKWLSTHAAVEILPLGMVMREAVGSDGE
jgi:hypothetical protein